MSEPEGQRTIYLAGAIRGGREDAALYREIATLLRQFGRVLTEHIGDATLSSSGQILYDAFIHDRDLEWLISRKRSWRKLHSEPRRRIRNWQSDRVGKARVMLFRPESGRALSAMIAGRNGIMLRVYQRQRN